MVEGNNLIHQIKCIKSGRISEKKPEAAEKPAKKSKQSKSKDKKAKK